MKVIAILGSPRKEGNSAVLAQEALKGAASAGAETGIFFANELNIKGCQACYACKKSGKCAIQDDMTGLYDAITKADAILFASPIYMWGMTAQLKLIIDRLYAYFNLDHSSRLPKNKKVGLIFTQGNPDQSSFQPYMEQVAKLLQFLGFGETRTLHGYGWREIDCAKRDQSMLKSAFDLGCQLAKS
ncbi:nadph-dependent fmn reductase [Lucifera butyrica]|uniref:Nadph-dependent fmn reductase n=1 Tax=Lucifera butyrica TaxID=1351585 RepID=A0A498R1T0_9FIRM|nr:flavodoxin family protein [Lucifera butyrica]VBB05331.1 nadph-dependent fmn reductase [Lucifera butyrica]